MGRGRVKRKKSTAVSGNDDPGFGGEDSTPAYKRRGRPQKPLKDEAEEDEVEKVEEEETKPDPKTYQEKPLVLSENRKKRKRNPRIKVKRDSKTDENGGPESGNEDSAKPNGFRHMGSRRKGKPQRGAEAVVECK